MNHLRSSRWRHVTCSEAYSFLQRDRKCGRGRDSERKNQREWEEEWSEEASAWLAAHPRGPPASMRQLHFSNAHHLWSSSYLPVTILGGWRSVCLCLAHSRWAGFLTGSKMQHQRLCSGLCRDTHGPFFSAQDPPSLCLCVSQSNTDMMFFSGWLSSRSFCPSYIYVAFLPSTQCLNPL